MPRERQSKRLAQVEMAQTAHQRLAVAAVVVVLTRRYPTHRTSMLATRFRFKSVLAEAAPARQAIVGSRTAHRRSFFAPAQEPVGSIPALALAAEAEEGATLRIPSARRSSRAGTAEDRLVPAVAAAALRGHRAQVNRARKRTPQQTSAGREAVAPMAAVRVQACSPPPRTAAMAAMEPRERDMEQDRHPLASMQAQAQMAAAEAAVRLSAARHRAAAPEDSKTSGRRHLTVRRRALAAAAVRAQATLPTSRMPKAAQAEAMAAVVEAVAGREAISQAVSVRKASSSSPIRRTVCQRPHAASAT